MPRHISEILDQVTEARGLNQEGWVAYIHPRIMAAAEREADGEHIDWEEVFAQVDADEARRANPRAQLLLGIA